MQQQSPTAERSKEMVAVLSTAGGDRVLSEAEAANFLKLSPRTLQRWRLAKFGPRFLRYSSRCIRYRLEDIRAWQDAQAVAVEARAANS